MDNSIRRNDRCVIGLPRCDFVFASTRSCFIAYGFQSSTLEVEILKALLDERGVQAVEAGGQLAPAQSAFCAKICSKIITSQFCAVLLNNDPREGGDTPNANVNMEYGLMLGFNKYVIPFQRAEQQLPFNVAGLDTVKYTSARFRMDAAKALDQAIEATTPKGAEVVQPEGLLETFLLSRGRLVSDVSTVDGKALYGLGSPLGFNLLEDFTGTEYQYFGRFANLRPELALWRVAKLVEVLQGRRASLAKRVELGLMNEDRVGLVEGVLDAIRIWIVVSDDAARSAIQQGAAQAGIAPRLTITTTDEADDELRRVYEPGRRADVPGS